MVLNFSLEGFFFFTLVDAENDKIIYYSSKFIFLARLIFVLLMNIPQYLIEK